MISRGFTLIEAIVYMALLGLIMTGAVTATYQILTSAGGLDTKNAIGVEGSFVLHKIEWALSATSTIARLTTPVSGQYANTLSLQRPDGASTRQIDFRRNPGTIPPSIEMSENGGTTWVPITTSNVSVSSLRFHTIAPSGIGAPFGVEASTTINNVVFYTIRYIRK